MNPASRRGDSYAPSSLAVPRSGGRLNPLSFGELSGWYADRASVAPAVPPRWLLPYERLLWWLSERGSGTWQQFRRAHEWVSVSMTDAHKAWMALRDLQSLGYIETSWESQEWAVAPPVLTLLPGSGGLAYLAGSRTRKQILTLREAAEDEEIEFFPEVVAQHRNGPYGVFVWVGSSSEARALAHRLGIGFSSSVATTLASMLPALEEMVSASPPATFPRGFAHSLFVPIGQTWELLDADAARGPGLYRIAHHGKPVFRLVTASGHLVVDCPLEAGVYEVLRWDRLRVMNYERGTWTLSVPPQAGLPPLHARAAVLCSGLLPRIAQDETGRALLAYDNVMPEVAQALIASLKQEAGGEC